MVVTPVELWWSGGVGEGVCSRKVCPCGVRGRGWPGGGHCEEDLLLLLTNL